MLGYILGIGGRVQRHYCKRKKKIEWACFGGRRPGEPHLWARNGTGGEHGERDQMWLYHPGMIYNFSTLKCPKTTRRVMFSELFSNISPNVSSHSQTLSTNTVSVTQPTCTGWCCAKQRLRIDFYLVLSLWFSTILWGILIIRHLNFKLLDLKKLASPISSKRAFCLPFL